MEKLLNPPATLDTNSSLYSAEPTSNKAFALTPSIENLKYSSEDDRATKSPIASNTSTTNRKSNIQHETIADEPRNARLVGDFAALYGGASPNPQSHRSLPKLPIDKFISCDSLDGEEWSSVG